MAVRAMTDCPSEETLAAFLDGHLDPEARERVMEHLADCGECREVVYAGEEMGRLGVAEGEGAPEVLEFRSRSRYPWAAIGVAAAAVLVFFSPPAQEQIAIYRTGGMSQVKKAYESMPRRPIESRLIGFTHHEAKPNNRSGNDSGDGELEAVMLRQAVERITTGDERSWRNLRARASGRLLLGERDEAVALMERAYALEPDSPGLYSDLAAVYVERARWNLRPEHAVQALDAAERAWNLARTPEAAWNRALALELTGRDEEARRAWKEFLKRDSSSPWSDEARQKLQRLDNR